jgi:hypothetical protein
MPLNTVENVIMLHVEYKKRLKKHTIPSTRHTDSLVEIHILGERIGAAVHVLADESDVGSRVLVIVLDHS